jgi:hypothetical protein
MGSGASSTTGRCSGESTNAPERSPVPWCKPCTRTFVNDQPDRSPKSDLHAKEVVCAEVHAPAGVQGRRRGAGIPCHPNQTAVRSAAGMRIGCRRFFTRPWGEGRR